MVFAFLVSALLDRPCLGMCDIITIQASGLFFLKQYFTGVYFVWYTTVPVLLITEFYFVRPAMDFRCHPTISLNRKINRHGEVKSLVSVMLIWNVDRSRRDLLPKCISG